MGIRGNRRINRGKASFMLLHKYIRLNHRDDSSTCKLGYLK